MFHIESIKRFKLPMHQLAETVYASLLNAPVPQGIIVMLIVGIITGSAIFGGTNTAILTTEVLAYIAVCGLGSMSLWLISHDRKTNKQFLTFTISFLILSFFLKLFGYPQHILAILHNLSIIFLMLYVFIHSVNDFIKHHAKH